VRRAHSIAVLNQKGGSAKTTTAVSAGAALAEQGASVLLVDLDAQANASSWLLGAVDPAPAAGLLDVLTGRGSIIDLVRPTPIENLSIVPASPALAAAAHELAIDGAETRLRAQLARLPPFDYVLVDCPPTLGALALQALVACQALLVPVTPDPLALTGLAALLATYDDIRARRLNAQLALAGIVVCRVTHTRVAGEVIALLRRRFGKTVLRPVVHDAVRLLEAPSHHQPITVYAPASRAAAEYRAVARDLHRRLVS
jgi:chromosome partitioning protein